VTFRGRLPRGGQDVALVPAAIPRPKAVLFDLFHTLVTVAPRTKSIPPTWEDLGLSRDDYERRWFDDTDGRATGRIQDPVEVIRVVIHDIDPTIPMERVRWAARRRSERFDAALVDVEPATVDAVARLRSAGVRTVLVSNACAGEIDAWPRSPLAPHFDATVFSCRVGVAKPDRGIYEHALSLAGARPDEAIFVGDGGSDEHRGARAVGLATALVTRHASEWWPEKMEPRRKLADWTFADVPEFVGALGL
jgi:putative hydrolase of the HAD superfamily